MNRSLPDRSFETTGYRSGNPDCFVDMSLLGSDFGFRVKASTLTVSGLGENAGHGFIFRAES